MVENYSVIAEQPECTVLAHYESIARKSEIFQSEQELEDSLIELLTNQGYKNPPITDEQSLIANLRVQLEALNKCTFSDAEWKRLFNQEIANETRNIEDKTELLQKQDAIIGIKRDNGEPKNVMLIDKENLANNTLQVIRQYVPSGGSAKNRYDVTILVNGLPMVHIELKRRGVSIRNAFNQIDRYQRESFWAGAALFGYVQLFVISNGTHTKYYSNTTRLSRESETKRQQSGGRKIESNSFEFTSFWSDAENNVIYDLEDFAKTFLKKRTLLNIITKYCVFTVDKELLAMRPYQISATERILLRIETAIKNRWQGTRNAGGYIWHTTGSGKTLTSFKTAQLATEIEGVEKVLFVVDRQDLDYQTMKEYDNYEKDCANSNTSSQILARQLNDDTSKIIITTIQKLSFALKRRSENYEWDVLGKNVVFIFDECHRSQFGKMHTEIRRAFKKYIMFGFTGTPIFAANAQKSGAVSMKTTAEIFGGELNENGQHTEALHKYVIVDAIRDKNVNKFRVDYIKTIKSKDGARMAEGKEEQKFLEDEKRIKLVAKYILDHFDQKTKRSESFKFQKIINVEEVVKQEEKDKKNSGKKNSGKKNDKVKVEEKKATVSRNGFNSIFAVDSVEMAKKYYLAFKELMSEPLASKYTIATIFSYETNEEGEDLTGTTDENPNDVSRLDATSKEFLKDVAIEDYNKRFGTEYGVEGDKFHNYYKDISLRMKNGDIDILIVVGMFLTGFDAKGLNTLWVDKNLRMHGLLQAYSRTNRILNSVKDCGNIVCFRDLEENTNESFAIFGNKDAKGIAFMRKFEDYYYGYDEKGKHHKGYVEIVNELMETFPIEKMEGVIKEEDKKAFVRLMGSFLKSFNLLSAYDEFCPEDDEKRKEIRIISEGCAQDYLSWYIDFYEEFNEGGGRGGDTNGGQTTDVEFEIELVKHVQIDIAYILMLVEKYKKSEKNGEDIRTEIIKGIKASPDLRNKLELIEKFLDRVSTFEGDVHEEWEKYLVEEKQLRVNKLIAEEKLKPEQTNKFLESCFAEGRVEENGTAITTILPPMPIFGGGNIRSVTKARVIEKIKSLFDIFTDI